MLSSGSSEVAPKPGLFRIVRRAAIVLGLAAIVSFGAWSAYDSRRAAASLPDPAVGSQSIEASATEVRQFCGACHAVPTADTFPRSAWSEQVAQGYRFFADSGMTITAPPKEKVIRYYENRAPETIPVLARTMSPPGEKTRFNRLELRPSDRSQAPAIANVRFLHLSDSKRLDVVACDMNAGLVLTARPYIKDDPLRVISRDVLHPGHSEAVDLDQDGIMDLIVADLGRPMPSDDRQGAVVWLKGAKDGTYTSNLIAFGLGRVSDVQAADFDQDGDLDLIAAVFGWHEVGEIIFIENQAEKGGKPKFAAPKRIDGRHGAIHVPTADIDGDGRIDFVAVISQEHESIVAFLNRGPGKFETKTLWSAPHPAWGMSGLQVVDLDSDGDLDMLFTNGDVFDTVLLRPDNGVHWLENTGNQNYTYHRIASMYGTHRAQAADLDNDGDLDIVATSFLPDSLANETGVASDLDSTLLLEQVKPREFKRTVLELGSCHHATLDLGDFDADGKIDLVRGVFVDFGMSGAKNSSGSKDQPWVIIDRNR